ncbi:dTMP kinase [Rickettsiales endosymbiont of Peranema trichophorum]|uniref:dTMP kinase n=1 Tax=Rickettsiales endosymbiont of Peranema trichophorum TaxID=2486577 RepID=UPI001022F169|nr:dTMP kinase [Rickettsiales endosymbiont of Peranema trichophorum]RZI47224.1 dTMP kinase [Rickettsiales endosymbiont of Peranema trichophorum]
MLSRGLFVTFEGGEASGKSTQVRILEDILTNLGFDVVVTREPGGTVFAEKLRSILLDGNGVTDPLTEFLLFNAARRDHVVNVIEKAVAQQKVVISDRFLDSSLVYQGYLKGISVDLIHEISRLSIGECTPDLTILLDVDPELARSRLKQSFSHHTHYDKADIQSFTLIREGFLKLAALFPDRIVTIPGNTDSCTLSAQIANLVLERIKARDAQSLSTDTLANNKDAV